MSASHEKIVSHDDRDPPSLKSFGITFAVVFAWTRSDVAMNANVLTTVVACYVLTLFAETLLSFRLISFKQAAARAS